MAQGTWQIFLKSSIFIITFCSYKPVTAYFHVILSVRSKNFHYKEMKKLMLVFNTKAIIALVTSNLEAIGMLKTPQCSPNVFP